ncbi:cupin domain-containing protein [Thalassotalea sp. PS06]|uniref:cupin domain-containing protein n=1 Tax=Thalassotalea sp. PS06 TaxID=2594005 RepID=UPI0011646A14|nr:cupin domain-containing protein [Thalassotalea sp. PS06]QDP02797.1 cupin domain-containing protein [Thalassotalea sp. PS06]
MPFRDGESISYPEGKAEITSIKLRLEPGQQTPFHCHPIPTFGYVLSGKIEVKTKDGNKTIMSEGESAIEVMNTYHRGRAIEGPVEIVVFYAGAEGIPTTVLEGDDGC